MIYIIKGVCTFFVLYSLIFIGLAGMFGVENFKKSHHPLLGILAVLVWIALMVFHLFTIYKIWFFNPVNYFWLLYLFLAIIEEIFLKNGIWERFECRLNKLDEGLRKAVSINTTITQASSTFLSL